MTQAQLDHIIEEAKDAFEIAVLEASATIKEADQDADEAAKSHAAMELV